MARPQLKVYSEEEIQVKLKEMGLDEWYYEDGWLRRKYNTDGWPTTLMLVNAIGYLAEAAWHHPGPVGHVGETLGQAPHASRQRDHRQGLRAGPEDRRRRPVATGSGECPRGHAE
jgi:hypothetical protein